MQPVWCIVVNANGCPESPEIYYAERMRLDKFLETTRSILEKMAEVAEEIESTIQVRFQQSIYIISKETRHITLLYHQVCAAHCFAPVFPTGY